MQIKTMQNDIRHILPDPFPTLHLMDAGAMSLGEPPPYQPALGWPQTLLFGFEPQPIECARLNASATANTRFFPVALGDGQTHTFHVGRMEATSSLFAPNLKLARQFRALAELMEVTRSSTIETTRLDDLAEIPPLHYMKLDVQGAELMILQNGLRQLASTVMIHLEVEFVPLYQGQPLFGDVDCFLRGQGFQFHRFVSVSGRTAPPFLMNQGPYEAMSQQLWADVLYIRDMEQWPTLAAEQLIRLAALLHTLYGSFDLAGLALDAAGAQCGLALKDAYLSLFGIPQQSLQMA
ncbi:MAG: FkbM family methyltransferase [Bryobacterales bacterium]|jgi:FkbM family methyltransferase|nr:FkbM family methyltransferase [Bryobacterales bacterium]